MVLAGVTPIAHAAQVTEIRAAIGEGLCEIYSLWQREQNRLMHRHLFAINADGTRAAYASLPDHDLDNLGDFPLIEH